MDVSRQSVSWESDKAYPEMKAWWAGCPAKPVVCGLSLLLAAVIVLGIYELGVVCGRWLYGFLL